MGITVIFAVGAVLWIGELISLHLGGHTPISCYTDTGSGSEFYENQPGPMHHGGIGLEDAGSIDYSTISPLSTYSADPFSEFATINPANGLPMIGGIGGMDVGGNAYGISHDIFESSTSGMLFGSCSSFSDLFSSSCDILGSSFGCGSDW